MKLQEFLDPCTIHGHAIVFGNATHLGAYTGTGEFYQDVCNPRILHTLAAFTWFAANGDELADTFEGYLTPTGTPGVFDNHETTDVTGGTGRFTGATGHWEAGGQIDLTTEPISFVTPHARVDLKCRLDAARKLEIVRRPILRIATSVRLVAMR